MQPPMTAPHRKPPAWATVFAFVTVALAGFAAWWFGVAGAGAVLVLAFVAFQLLDVLFLRAPSSQDHMTKNPGRGS